MLECLHWHPEESLKQNDDIYRGSSGLYTSDTAHRDASSVLCLRIGLQCCWSRITVCARAKTTAQAN